jgi:uncharacterized membrane protein
MREVIEGLQTQGPNEAIIYRLTVTPAAVSVVSVSVTDLTTGTNVTATTMPAGTASVSDGSIILPALTALTLGHLYEVGVLYSDGQSQIEPIIRVLCS